MYKRQTITQTDGSSSVTEGGSTDLITVVLDAQPTSDVVISVVSNDTGEVSPSGNLTFTSANWDTPQTITVTGVDDDLVDGTQTSTVTLSVVDASSDNDFDGVADQTVSVTTTDDDTAGFTIVETGGSSTVTEGGSTDLITVVLDAQPTSDVVLSVVSCLLYTSPSPRD